MKKLFLLLILILYKSTFALDNLDVDPTNDTANDVLSRRYRHFGTVYNNSNNFNAERYGLYFDTFKQSIYYPVTNVNNIDYINDYNPQNYLNRIRDIQNSLRTESNNPRYPILFSFVKDKLLSSIDHRIDLAGLDISLHSNNIGIRGNQINTIDDIFYRSLRTITGGIFQVSLINEEIDINNSIIKGPFSGTLISYDPTNNRINNLESNNQRVLNAILTCAHAFGADDGRYAFFFVQTSNLNGDTGVPNGVNVLTGDTGIINFLNTNDASYRINLLRIKNRYNNAFTDIDLRQTQPQYDRTEDIVIARLGLRNNQDLPIYDVNYSVQFQQNNMITNQITYVAGYPSCDHFGRGVLPDALQDRRVSPFWVSGANNHNLISNINGTLTHSIPSAKGMSGGPIFQQGDSNLNILGVITGGRDNDKRGCHWR
jgi:hypothetical protein